MAEPDLVNRIEQTLISRAILSGSHSPKSNLTKLYDGALETEWGHVRKDLHIDHRDMYNKIMRIINPILHDQLKLDFDPGEGYRAQISLVAEEKPKGRGENYFRLKLCIYNEKFPSFPFRQSVPTGINRHKDDRTVSNFATTISSVYSIFLDSVNMKTVDKFFEEFHKLN